MAITRVETREPVTTVRPLIDGLHGTIVGFRRWLIPELARSGVTPTQFWLMHNLESTGAVACGGLATRLEVKMPSITSIVDSLEHDGLVRRVRGVRDRRVVQLELSAKGRQLLARIWSRLEREVRGKLRGVDARDIRAAARILGRLGSSLGVPLQGVAA